MVDILSLSLLDNRCIRQQGCSCTRDQLWIGFGKLGRSVDSAAQTWQLLGMYPSMCNTCREKLARTFIARPGLGTLWPWIAWSLKRKQFETFRPLELLWHLQTSEPLESVHHLKVV